ncbi:hypothetical protein E2C01_028945 [Portunus trituberculatus]|uniref:Uncharacterized protein n=1 Tax=Portunus trituberculatus TaxID=210409 RepID=A0A5B7ELT7_PORTR|nr:hypothetical protein [Portunus trituberculatus]
MSASTYLPACLPGCGCVGPLLRTSTTCRPVPKGVIVSYTWGWAGRGVQGRMWGKGERVLAGFCLGY